MLHGNRPFRQMVCVHIAREKYDRESIYLIQGNGRHGR
jgi:hypothetical protein